jgi:hypothetical protein
VDILQDKLQTIVDRAEDFVLQFYPRHLPASMLNAQLMRQRHAAQQRQSASATFAADGDSTATPKFSWRLTVVFEKRSSLHHPPCYRIMDVELPSNSPPLRDALEQLVNDWKEIGTAPKRTQQLPNLIVAVDSMAPSTV